MRKLLTILRHGNAEITNGEGDFNRKLTYQGREEIKKIFKILKNRNTGFDYLINSPAVRTQETAELLLSEVTIPKVDINEAIYEGSLENLIEILSKIPKDISNVLVIGHNPTLTALIGYLTMDYNINVLPGMMVRLEVYIGNWDHIGQGSASLFEVLHEKYLD